MFTRSQSLSVATLLVCLGCDLNSDVYYEEAPDAATDAATELSPQDSEQVDVDPAGFETEPTPRSNTQVDGEIVANKSAGSESEMRVVVEAEAGTPSAAPDLEEEAQVTADADREAGDALPDMKALVRELLEPKSVKAAPVFRDIYAEADYLEEAFAAFAETAPMADPAERMRAQIKILLPALQVALRDSRKAVANVAQFRNLPGTEEILNPIDFNLPIRALLDEASDAAASIANSEISLAESARLDGQMLHDDTFTQTTSPRVYRAQTNAFAETVDDIVYFTEPEIVLSSLRQRAFRGDVFAVNITISLQPKGQRDQIKYRSQVPYGNPGTTGRWEKLEVVSAELSFPSLDRPAVKGHTLADGDSFLFNTHLPRQLSTFHDSKLTVHLRGVKEPLVLTNLADLVARD